MKHKTWFRLVLKAIGVLLIGLSMQSLLPLIVYLAGLVIEFFGEPLIDLEFMSYSWQFYVGGVGQFVLGLYLFLGGKWLVNKCIPSNRPYCPDCGYDLSKATGPNCPECGVTIDPPKPQG